VTSPVDSVLDALQERAKELACLYRVNEICNRQHASIDEIFHNVVDVLPGGWQFPGECQARITADNVVYAPDGLVATAWVQSAPIRVQGEEAGSVEVFYLREKPAADEGPFLKEERKLIDTVAERLGQLLLHRKLLDRLHGMHGPEREPVPAAPRGDWRVIVEFLRKTDPSLLARVSRRMINYLCWDGIAAAQDLLPRFTGTRSAGEEAAADNRPLERQGLDHLVKVAD